MQRDRGRGRERERERERDERERERVRERERERERERDVYCIRCKRLRSNWRVLDGKHIVSGSGDKTVRIWDAATGKDVSFMCWD